MRRATIRGVAPTAGPRTMAKTITETALITDRQGVPRTTGRRTITEIITWAMAPIRDRQEVARTVGRRDTVERIITWGVTRIKGRRVVAERVLLAEARILINHPAKVEGAILQ